MTAIAERVAAGAAFLDEREPGWWSLDRESPLHTSQLYVGSSCDCVLGQLFGSYLRGIRTLGLREPGVNREALGFMFISADSDAERDRAAEDADIEALTREWERVITGRRAAS
jgi:hypothetical protein